MQVWGKELSTPLFNLIELQHLDPGRHQKVLDRYEVVYLGWSEKDLDNINTDLTLINQGL